MRDKKLNRLINKLTVSLIEQHDYVEDIIPPETMEIEPKIDLSLRPGDGYKLYCASAGLCFVFDYIRGILYGLV